MKLFMIYFSMILSNMFFFANHPIAIVILIILQSIILCLSIFFLLNSSWFSLVMFLIFMGGLMVLFIYIASLASNELFIINIKYLLSITLVSFVTLMVSLYLNLSINMLNQSINFKMKIFPIYSESFFSPTIIAMLYLLLTLIITVNIIKLYDAPIRSSI